MEGKISSYRGSIGKVIHFYIRLRIWISPYRQGYVRIWREVKQGDIYGLNVR